MIRGLYKLLILSLMLGVVPGASLRAESAPSNEYKIKAALIYNFLKFTEWPEKKEWPEKPVKPEDVDLNRDSGQSRELVLGLYGSDDIYKTCLSLRGKTVKNRKIRIKRLQEKDFKDKDLKALKEIDVLYLSNTWYLKKKVDLKKLLETLKHKSILTIGETKGFLEIGGIINFLKESNHIRFEINLDAAKNAKLHIKTSVLKLAKRVLQRK